VRQESIGRSANCTCAAGSASRVRPHEMSWKVEGSMAITDELIETLGGGGTVGLAVAAVVLVPTMYPPARRGIRGLAKAAIVQYLKVTEPRAAETPAAEDAIAAAVAPARRRGRPARAAGNGAAAETPAPRARGAEPAAAAAETPARAPRPRGQQAPAAA